MWLFAVCGRCAQNKGRSLPKFGEWDVKNPATADGFTVIFQRARDDKKTTAGPGKSVIPPAFRNADGGYGSVKTGNTYKYTRVATPKRSKVRACVLCATGMLWFIACIDATNFCPQEKSWFFCGSCRF